MDWETVGQSADRGDGWNRDKRLCDFEMLNEKQSKSKNKMITGNIFWEKYTLMSSLGMERS